MFSPTPTVEWYKDGVRIQNFDNTGRTNFAGYTLSYNDVELKIVRPRKEDEGVFRCWIRNSKGAKNKDSNLLVHCKFHQCLFVSITSNKTDRKVYALSVLRMKAYFVLLRR